MKCTPLYRFQALSAAYKFLSDEEKRKVYDETGEVDDEDVILDMDKDWDQYWRLLFKVGSGSSETYKWVQVCGLQKITITDVKEFEKKYRHSEEEMTDLKQAYLDGDGDMNYVLSSVPCCTDEDVDRYADLLLSWAEKDQVPMLPKFRRFTTKELKLRKRKAGKEAKEAEEMAK